MSLMVSIKLGNSAGEVDLDRVDFDEAGDVLPV